MRFFKCFAVLILLAGCEPTTMGGPLAIGDKRAKGPGIPKELFERGFIGISFGHDTSKPAIIESVERGGSADQSGLLPGDEIKSINDAAVSSAREFLEIAKKWKPDGSVQIKLKRGDSIKDFKINLMEFHDLLLLKEKNGGKGK